MCCEFLESDLTSGQYNEKRTHLLVVILWLRARVMMVNQNNGTQQFAVGISAKR